MRYYQKFLLWLGHWHRYPHFPFFVYKPPVKKIRASMFWKLGLKKGDIILQNDYRDFSYKLIRASGWYSRKRQPQKWCHSMIMSGDHEVIHATKDGVVEEDILDVIESDEMVILKVPPQYINFVTGSLIKIRSEIGKAYDMDFEQSDEKFYCHELTCRYLKHMGIIVPTDKVLDKEVWLGDTIFSTLKDGSAVY